LEAFRQRGISAYQLRALLGIPSRWELDRLLKDHRVETYIADDFDHDLASIQQAEELRKAEPRP
jgi:Uncharacterised protein family (UPF0175)